MSSSIEQQSKKQQIATFWIIWLGLLCGTIFLQIFIGGSTPSDSNIGDPPLFTIIIASIPAIISIAIRVQLIPKVTQVERLLTTMIIGAALAEATCILSIFQLGANFPETKLILFAASLICLLLYAPTYASALINGKEKDQLEDKKDRE